MLIEFSVENFRSFKKRATLSLMASADRTHVDNLLPDSTMSKNGFLRSAAVFGANASGKSNLIMAMALLRNFVIGSHQYQKGTRLNHQPFAFDPECESQPTRFEAVFVRDGTRYRYSLAYDADGIVEEELKHYPKGRPATVFSRHGQEFEFTCDRKEQEVLSRRTLENVLYLSSSVQFNYSGTLPAFQWFMQEVSVFAVVNPDPLIEVMVERVNRDKRLKQMVLKALAIADLGIVGMEGSVRRIPLQELHGKAPKELIGVMTLMGAEEARSNEVMLRHEVGGGKQRKRSALLPLGAESEGTKRMLALILPVLEALRDGKVLFIDELDTKMHFKLSSWLVDLFHDPEQNRKGAQLVFNTHEQQFLDLDRLRRDQIWFVEKDPVSGSSELFSLAEFGERKDKDVQKAYALGRYGAVPFLSPGRILD